jgi:hypothetical protein
MLTVEAYAQQWGRLHPEVLRVLQPYFPSYDLKRARFELRPRGWRLFGWSGRGSRTPVFVLGRTIYLAQGFLNKSGWLWGNTMDLALETGSGWETLAHELIHTEQGSLPRMLPRYLGGVVRSLWANVRGRRWWNHDVIPFEREAIDRAAVIRKAIVKKAQATFWPKWREIG